MERFCLQLAVSAALLVSALSCEVLDNDPGKHVSGQDRLPVSLEDVAGILSSIPLQVSQVSEVHDAVCSSSGNGYDEEYTMDRIFASPGSGVGDPLTKGGDEYEVPLRELIENHVRTMTRAGGMMAWNWARTSFSERSRSRIFRFTGRFPGIGTVTLCR